MHVVLAFTLTADGWLTPDEYSQVNEFEVTLQRPGAGLSTGSGTVGGARVIAMDEVGGRKEGCSTIDN